MGIARAWRLGWRLSEPRGNTGQKAGKQISVALGSKKLFLDVISSIVSLSSPLTKDHVNGAQSECVLMITKVRTRLHALKQTVS